MITYKVLCSRGMFMHHKELGPLFRARKFQEMLDYDAEFKLEMVTDCKVEDLARAADYLDSVRGRVK